MARNSRKFFCKGNEFGHGNCFVSGRIRFGKSRGYGNKGEGSSRKQRECYNYGNKGHFISECPKLKKNKAFVGGAWSDSKDGNQPDQKVITISVISISSDSSEESMGTSTARVILFGTIPTTISSTIPIADLPIIHDDTPLIPTDTPTISPIVPTIPPIAPTIQYTSPFVCTDSSNSDTPDTPSSPIHDSPPTLCQILPAPPELPHSLPETSSDSHSDTSFNSSSRHSSSSHSLSDSPCDSLTIFMGPYRKRRRSLTNLVNVASPIPEALSPVRADLLPSCKRIRDSDSVTNFKISSEEGFVPHVPREIGLGVDVEDSYEPYTEPDIDPDVQANIDSCIAFADDIEARGTDVRVEDGNAAEEEAESSARGTIKISVDRVTHPVVSDDTTEPVRKDYLDLVSTDGSLNFIQRGLDVFIQELYDHMMEIPVHRVRVIESVQRDQGHKIMASAAMSEMISTLERDNIRLRGMLGVERGRVDHLRRSMSYVQRDLRQIHRFHFYDRVRLKRPETYARRHLGYRP
ncbi:reverse transcriptase domain-containing protein [Tanacetum coccineum]